MLHRLERFRLLGSDTGSRVIDEQARQVEHPCHPGDHGDNMQRFHPEIHLSLPAYAFKHTFNMRDRRVRQYSMPEIKNQRTITQMAQHVIDLTIKSCTAGQEREWINITLHRDT